MAAVKSRKREISKPGRPLRRKRQTPAANHSSTGARTRKVVRRRSRATLFGWPLWEIARGPDPARGQSRGHARAVFAVGDIADGVVAVGGISRGIVAIGGVAAGVFALGGVAVGLIGALGGLALAPLAMGGAAVGAAARGGAALGVFARGRAVAGLHVVKSQPHHRRSQRNYRRLARFGKRLLSRR